LSLQPPPSGFPTRPRVDGPGGRRQGATRGAATMESTRFDQSRWAEQKFSQDYRDEANHYLPFRRFFIEVAKSVAEFFTFSKTSIKILDLGCGDGFFIEQFQPRSSDEIVLIDGSAEMLSAAQRRLANFKNITYVQHSFQEIMAQPLSRKFDFVFSSLAIHHLSPEDKYKLYKYIYDHLERNGIFINYDVVLAPSEALEKWYVSFWQDYIERNAAADIKEKVKTITLRYKGNPDNIPDTLAYQMGALQEIGYSNVDCYFKFGLFSLFGGTK
jgi:tRNA (cmo5U34)-methyltransferase